MVKGRKEKMRHTGLESLIHNLRVFFRIIGSGGLTSVGNMELEGEFALSIPKITQ